jgi:hypothetical protein
MLLANPNVADVDQSPTWTYAVVVILTVPEAPTRPVPNACTVSSADDGPVDVDASIDIHISIDVDVGTSIDVDTGSSIDVARSERRHGTHERSRERDGYRKSADHLSRAWRNLTESGFPNQG